MGFSFFSIIELVYFMSVRPYYENIRIHRKQDQAVQHIVHRLKENVGVKDKPVKVKSTKIKSIDDRIFYPYLE